VVIKLIYNISAAVPRAVK
jgi:hypothetical protein